MGRIYQPTTRDKVTGERKPYAIWWIEYSVRGKQHRESSKSTNPADARRLLKNRMEQIGTGRFVGPQAERTTFDDPADMLLNDYKANGKRLDRIEMPSRTFAAFSLRSSGSGSEFRPRSCSEFRPFRVRQQDRP